MLRMYCAKQKAAVYATEEEDAALQRTGLRVPLKQHACIYQGANKCAVCKEPYAGFQ